MKRYVLSALLVLLVCVVAVPVACAEEEYVAKAVYVEGGLDITADWPLDKGYPADVITDLTTRDPIASLDKFSAKVWTFYDNRYLYVYLDVVDVTPLLNYQDRLQVFMGDCVEVAFATGIAANEFVKYIVAENSMTGQIMAAVRPLKLDKANLAEMGGEFAILKKADGTGYIFKGKFDTEHEEFAFLDLSSVSDMLFDIAVANSDTGVTLDNTVILKGHVNKRGEHGKLLLVK